MIVNNCYIYTLLWCINFLVKAALCWHSDRRFAARLPVTVPAPRTPHPPTLALSPHPQFPEAKKLSHFFCLASSFYFLTEDTAETLLAWFCLIGHRPPLSSAGWRSAWLKVGESSGVISSSVNSCRGKLSKDSVHHSGETECPGQCRSHERARAGEGQGQHVEQYTGGAQGTWNGPSGCPLY